MDDKELLQRVRRIETRLTKLMEYLGFDTQVHRPTFIEDHTGERFLQVPSRLATLRDCLAAVEGDTGVSVRIGDERICDLIP